MIRDEVVKQARYVRYMEFIIGAYVAAIAYCLYMGVFGHARGPWLAVTACLILACIGARRDLRSMRRGLAETRLSADDERRRIDEGRASRGFLQ